MIMAKLQDKDFEQVSGGDMSLPELLEGDSTYSNMIEHIIEQLATPGLSQQMKTDLQTLLEECTSNLSKIRSSENIIQL